MGRDEAINKVIDRDKKVEDAIISMGDKERKCHDKELKDIIDRKFKYIELPVKKNKNPTKHKHKSSRRLRRNDR